MNKARLEAFSDGVLAIIITIMVLELKPPEAYTWPALKSVLIELEGYLISFIMVGIYWVNHHHLLHTVKRVNAKIMWANMHLLFWLSLLPFATKWVGENDLEKIPVIAYAVLLLLCGVAYTLLQNSIESSHTFSEKMAHALKRQDRKGMVSIAFYVTAIGTAFYQPAFAELLFFAVAIMWIIPDKNIERAMEE